MSVRTIYLTKDDVEYELEVEASTLQPQIEQVVIVKGGISRPETEIDPDVFTQTLTENDWSRINEALDNGDD